MKSCALGSAAKPELNLDANDAPDKRSTAQKRGLTLGEAAKHTGVSQSAFRDWVRKGIVPGPWHGTRRYDLRALDAALDRISGLAGPASKASAYDHWKEGKVRHASSHSPQAHKVRLYSTG